MTASHILALDQGTTSSRALIFDNAGRIRATAQRELTQGYPRPGRVEHDPEQIWRDSRDMARQALASAALAAADIAAIGITNQRETTVIWDRATGAPVHPAIVWQDRRTAALCRELRAEGAEPEVTRRTGLLLDPYFSATKIRWLLDNIQGLRARAERGELAFGTIDSFLLWRLTGGAVHATDAANASRTALFNIAEQRWDAEMLRLFDVPRALLPEVVDNAGELGMATADLLGAPVPVRGMAGDQQAATFGQACFARGMVKSTFGTGCFSLVNTGTEPAASGHRLLSTVLWRLDGQPVYALEGAIFVAGAAVQWLRDKLGVIARAAETQDLAESLAGNDGVYLVPGFVGLGAPYWDTEARGAVLGLTLDSGPAHLARATLESMGYQSRDLLDAMNEDLTALDLGRQGRLRVDGGMVANDWMCQFLADMLQMPVERPAVTETTALGAACLAGLASGIFADLDAIAGIWALDRRFEPRMSPGEAERLYAGWREAVARVSDKAG